MNRHDTTDPEASPADATGTPDNTHEPVLLVSRVRAIANFFFLVAGILFLLGFLLTIALSGTMIKTHMFLLTRATAYAGLVAGVAFVTSIISITIENRKETHGAQEDQA